MSLTKAHIINAIADQIGYTNPKGSFVIFWNLVHGD